jgi:hypothetical protein
VKVLKGDSYFKKNQLTFIFEIPKSKASLIVVCFAWEKKNPSLLRPGFSIQHCLGERDDVS